MQIARRLLLLAVFVGLLVTGWYFAASNSAQVHVDYLVDAPLDLELWAALGLAFSGGAAAAAVLALYLLVRGGLLTRRYRKKIAVLEAELHQLRNLPLVGDETAPAQDALGAPGGGSGSEP
jgi:uncharacterized membrane protein YciS (DUF1049 family)